jgi:hypothetical protein
MKYKLTLTNELGEVLDWWLPTYDGSEPVLEDGNVHFDLDDDDDGLYLLDEVKRAIGQAENADASQEGEGLEYGGPDAGCSEFTPGQPHGPQPKYSGPLKITVQTPYTPHKTWDELRSDYLDVMDNDRDIAQKWKLRSIDWDVAKEQIAANTIKRNKIINLMDALNKGK